MRLLAIVLLSSVLTSNTLLAQSPYDIFQEACVENLHDYPNAELFLTQSNWSQANIDTFNEPANTLVNRLLSKFPLAPFNSHKPLFGNVLFHGLAEDHGKFFVSEDGKSAVVFGKADNDLNPNSKCMFASIDKETAPFSRWADEVFKGQKHETNVGSRYGNIRSEWMSLDFPQNLSAEVPIAAVILHKKLNKSRLTRAYFQVSTTGLIPDDQAQLE